MKKFKLFSILFLISIVLINFNLYPELIRKDGGNYFIEEENNHELEKEKQYLKEATAGEHKLARMQRVAHSYAYGDQGKGKGWENKKFLTRIKADGFTVVETFQNSHGGAAAIVLKDETTGEYIISVRGTDDLRDVGSDIKEAKDGKSIGVQQYADNKNVFGKLIEEYSSKSSNGKVIVAGHSLGAGVAGILAHKYPGKISRGYSFQGPGQTSKSAEIFNQLPEDKRPEMFLAVASPDGVAYAGAKHPGNPKVFIAHSGKMYSKKEKFGHGTRFFQNRGLKDWKGEVFITADHHVALAEFDFDEYAKFRRPYEFKNSETNVQWIKKWKNLGTELSMTVTERFIEQIKGEIVKGKDKKKLESEILFQLERQGHVLKREKNLKRYQQFLTTKMNREKDPLKKLNMQQDLILLKEMMAAIDERKKKGDLKLIDDKLVSIWKKRYKRVLGKDEKEEKTSKDFSIKISSSRKLFYTGDTNKIYMNSKGGKPKLIITGDHTGTYSKLYGTTFVYKAPPEPGNYEIKIKAMDADGFVARDKIPIRVIARAKWPVTLTGDLEGDFFIYPINRKFKGKFDIDGINGAWVGKYDMKKSWLHGKIGGKKGSTNMKGDFAGRRTGSKKNRGWQGTWKLGELNGKFQIKCSTGKNK
ncbi:hypothetical protein KAJ27_00290 [bacterium]|nr:hypothetical protein [bacterium]